MHDMDWAKAEREDPMLSGVLDWLKAQKALGNHLYSLVGGHICHNVHYEMLLAQHTSSEEGKLIL